MHRDGPRPSRSRGTDQAFARTYLFFHERRSRGDNAGRMEGVGEGGGGGGEEEESSVGPEGALDFHYAKPQMESCDRVSLCATPGGTQSRWNKAPKV